RTTLPRFMSSVPLQTDRIEVERRISAIFKDLPGGQLLGPTFDYTHRLLDFSLLAGSEAFPAEDYEPPSADPLVCPRVSEILAQEGLLGREVDTDGPVFDITREPLDFPTTRAQRLQTLA